MELQFQQCYMDTRGTLGIKSEKKINAINKNMREHETNRYVKEEIRR